MTLVAVLVGALVIGSALGLLGGGGTILTVPLLHGLLGVPTPQAVAMSLPIVAIAAASGAVVGWRRRAFAVTPTLGLAVTTAAGAYVGALVGQTLSARTQSTLLGITLVAAAIAMWRGGRSAPAPPVGPQDHFAKLPCYLWQYNPVQCHLHSHLLLPTHSLTLLLNYLTHLCLRHSQAH